MLSCNPQFMSSSLPSAAYLSCTNFTDAITPAITNPIAPHFPRKAQPIPGTRLPKSPPTSRYSAIHHVAYRPPTTPIFTPNPAASDLAPPRQSPTPPEPTSRRSLQVLQYTQP